MNSSVKSNKNVKIDHGKPFNRAEPNPTVHNQKDREDIFFRKGKEKAHEYGTHNNNNNNNNWKDQ